MVVRCEFSRMALRPTAFTDVKNVPEDHLSKPRTFAQPTSLGAQSVGSEDDERHFLATLDARDRIMRLPRDSVRADHDYIGAATTGICVRCRENLPGPSHASQQPNQFPSPDRDSIGQSVRSQLLGFRDLLFSTSTDTAADHLQELLALQARLILQQQQQLLQKETLNQSLVQDKEQLTSRIERLERRVSVLQKSGLSSEQNSPRGILRTSSTESPLPLGIKRSSSSLINRSLSTPSTAPETGKRKCLFSQKKLAIIAQNAVEEDADIVYTSNYPSPLPFPIEHNDEIENENENENDDQLLSTAIEDVEPVTNNDEIQTPGWKVCSSQPVPDQPSSPEPQEDVSDEAFLRRHRKHEDNEKRRKRWDNQRFREQKERENLLRRYKKVHMKGGKGGGKDSKLDSFSSTSRQVDEIHVMDRLPVTAFGTAVPRLEPSSFKLPWFEAPRTRTHNSSSRT